MIALVSIFLLQLFIMLVVIDAVGRTVADKRIKQGRMSADFTDGMSELKFETMPYRFLVLGNSAVLLLFALRNCSKKEAR